jgi:hypothetical protein
MITDIIVHYDGKNVVLLPGFQKGRDIKASQGKGQGAVLAKKGNLHCTRKNLKNGQNFIPFTCLGSIKCFPLSFNTYKTLQVAPRWSWYHKLPIKDRAPPGK